MTSKLLIEIWESDAKWWVKLLSIVITFGVVYLLLLPVTLIGFWWFVILWAILIPLIIIADKKKLFEKD